MPRGAQPKVAERENRMTYAAIRLFLENGYERTTTAAIAQAAGMFPSAFFAVFANKEALLLKLTKWMYEKQFAVTHELLGKDYDPVMFYAVDPAIQLYIAEKTEGLRELYVSSYSYAATANYIHQVVTDKLVELFGKEHPGYTRSERSVGNSFDALFKGCEERIIVTTFASNVDRLQQIIDVAARYGRRVAVTGRSMENAMKVSTELGYMNIPDGVLMDLNQIKSLPKNRVCIITTGSQGETMSALSRMAFSTHRQVDILPGDRIIISASAIPGNEHSIGNVINELYRKGAEVLNERELALHVSGHACQEELKIIHALVKPKFFIPVHGEQRMLQTHAKLAREMGMDSNHILISDIGRVMELTQNSARLAGTVTAGQVFVDGLGVGDVGSVVLRDRRHLAQDGMIVVVMSMSGEDGSLVSGPDLITRGFVYVKESEGLMEELRQVALEAINSVDARYSTDWSAIKGAVKGDLSNYLYKKTKRSPMILPVIMEV